jgi:Protein of unknown function (DUF3592)
MRKLGISLLLWLGTIAIALLAGYVKYTHATASLSWPTTSGVVEVAEVNQVSGRYWPKLVYAYQVQGVDHKGHNVGYLDLHGPSLQGSTDPQWPRDHLAHLSLGDHVSVHYDPSDPGQSWLLVAPINFWQCVPGWGFFLQMLGATAVMQRLLVTRKVWLFVPGLFCIFVLWVWFFISMRPTP